MAPTHWSFGQLASLVSAPAAYLRQLPAPLAGINLQYGLTNHRAEQVKTMEVANGRTELRAVDVVEYATLEWVDWFNNRRLLEPIGNVPPAEAEANFYAALETSEMAA